MAVIYLAQQKTYTGSSKNIGADLVTGKGVPDQDWYPEGVQRKVSNVKNFISDSIFPVSSCNCIARLDMSREGPLHG